MSSRLAALVLLLGGSWLATQGRDGADTARETVCKTTIELGAGKSLELRYRTVVWSEERAALMRRDPAVRDQMNQRLPVGLQSELVTPVALSLGGRRIEPGTYRFGLWMNEAGAFELSLLIEEQYVRFPLELSEADQNFPYLTCSLLPASEGGYSLVFQWGHEYGRCVVDLAR